jgi:NitT/TauT family transport system substrate-binding protein
MRTRTRFLMAFVLIFAAVGCGTDDDTATSTPTDTAETETAESTDGEAGRSTDEEGGGTDDDGGEEANAAEDLGELTLAVAAPGIPFLQVDVAEIEGFYEEHGITVERLGVEGSAAATAAVESGQADLMVTLPEGVITARAAGSSLKMIGATVNENLYRLYAGEEFSSLEDLAGEDLGMLVEGNGTDIQLRWLLDEHGAGSDQSTFVAVGGLANRLAAVQQGQVAAALLFPPFDEQAEASGLTELAFLGDYVDGYPNEVFAAREEVLAEKPDAFRAFMAAIEDATQFIIDNPDEATDIAVDVTDGERDVVESSMQFTLPTFGTEISEEGLQWTLDVIERYLGTEDMPTTDDLYDPSFLPE